MIVSKQSNNKLWVAFTLSTIRGELSLFLIIKIRAIIQSIQK